MPGRTMKLSAGLLVFMVTACEEMALIVRWWGCDECVRDTESFKEEQGEQDTR
jgi:hypothetical protein